jgi:flagellar biosynthesis protein FlhB
MAEQDGDKSQEATSHRRQQSREQGQVAKSQDFNSAVLLLVGLFSLMMFGTGLRDYLAQYWQEHLGGHAWLSADVDFAVAEWNHTLFALARFLVPIMGFLFLGAIAVNLLQIGFLFLPDKLALDISHLDPLKGLGRIFSMANAVRLVFSLIKLGIIATVAFVSLYQQRQAILSMTGMAIPQVAVFLAQILFWTSVKIGIALLVLAILDFGFQWWKHEQDIRMTSQEVREEMKNLEGNPQVISRRRAVQRQLAMSRLSTAMPKADVVVTNPTELAIAIQYDPETMAAPVVVAKGAGLVAERIRRLALEQGIPIVEKKPLAQALYKEVDVNKPIPPDKYAAVAEVLAYVYQLKGKQIPQPAAGAPEYGSEERPGTASGRGGRRRPA